MLVAVQQLPYTEKGIVAFYLTFVVDILVYLLSRLELGLLLGYWLRLCLLLGY